MTRWIGAHMSTSGGLHNAPLAGVRFGCTAIQIFSKNNHQLSAKPLTPEEITQFKSAVQKSQVTVPLSHCAYLINLASPKNDNYHRSLASMQMEVERAAQLDIPYVILHPGSHTESGVEAGVARIADAINRVHDAQQTKEPMILLECMAGQGSCIGSTFEELLQIMEKVKDQNRIGICIDTCHLFAAGYDIRTGESFAKILDRFAELIGIERIKAFHLNDSKKGLASRVDRHEHIGKGEIGLEAFRYLLNDDRLAEIPMVLETPKNDDGSWDQMNMETLRSLMRQKATLAAS